MNKNKLLFTATLLFVCLVGFLGVVRADLPPNPTNCAYQQSGTGLAGMRIVCGNRTFATNGSVAFVGSRSMVEFTEQGQGADAPFIRVETTNASSVGQGLYFAAGDDISRIMLEGLAPAITIASQEPMTAALNGADSPTAPVPVDNLHIKCADGTEVPQAFVTSPASVMLFCSPDHGGVGVRCNNGTEIPSEIPGSGIQEFCAERGGVEQGIGDLSNPDPVDGEGPRFNSLNPTCAQLSNCAIKDRLVQFTNALIAIVGIVIVTMITVGGVQYSAARDNPQATAAAKARITNAILALVCYLFISAFLQWLVPGGVF